MEQCANSNWMFGGIEALSVFSHGAGLFLHHVLRRASAVADRIVWPVSVLEVACTDVRTPALTS